MAIGARQALKVYSGLLGLSVCIAAFMWVCLQIYLVSETDEGLHDLRMARYLDICFGLLAFFSSMALMYGAFVESKTWLSAWTLGSMTVVIGMWAWYWYGKYTAVNPHPEVKTDFEKAGGALTLIYFLAEIPVWTFQRRIEYWDFRFTWDFCPTFVLSVLPIRRSASAQLQASAVARARNGCHSRRAPNQAGGPAGRGYDYYLPSYAQSCTNTFLAPSHTHVNHIPVSKGEIIHSIDSDISQL